MGEALVADACGGLFSDTDNVGSVIVAISVLLVDNDGLSDGDCGVVRVGARLRLEESDDGSGAAARLGASNGVADGASVGTPVGSSVGESDGVADGASVGIRELYSFTPVGSIVGESDGVADGASVGIRELYSFTPVGSSVGESDGVADGASVGIRELYSFTPVGSSVGESEEEVVAPPGDGDTITGKSSTVLGVGVGLGVVVSMQGSEKPNPHPGVAVLSTDARLGEDGNVGGLEGAPVGLHTIGVVSLNVARTHSSGVLEIEGTLSTQHAPRGRPHGRRECWGRRRRARRA